MGYGVFVAPGVDENYVPLLMVGRTLDIVVTVDDEGPVKNFSDLAGTVVGTLLRGLRTWLAQRSIMRRAGLDRKRHMTFREFRTAKDCVLTLSSGQVAACGISEPILRAVEGDSANDNSRAQSEAKCSCTRLSGSPPDLAGTA